MRRCAFTVHGRVQGVGYRQFAVRAATAQSVAGWVRNAPDGTVCGEAEGGEEAVGAFLDQLRQGPRWGEVRLVEVAEIELRGGAKFEVQF